MHGSWGNPKGDRGDSSLFFLTARPNMILCSTRSGSTQLLPPKASGCLLTEVSRGHSTGGQGAGERNSEGTCLGWLCLCLHWLKRQLRFLWFCLPLQAGFMFENAYTNCCLSYLSCPNRMSQTDGHMNNRKFLTILRGGSLRTRQIQCVMGTCSHHYSEHLHILFSCVAKDSKFPQASVFFFTGNWT